MVKKKIIPLFFCIIPIIIIVIIIAVSLRLTFWFLFDENKERNTIEVADPSEFVVIDGFEYDNSNSLENILTTEYSLEELEAYFGRYYLSLRLYNKNINLDEAILPSGHGFSWEAINSNFPVECLRYNQNYFYSVYKVKEGGLYYLFWNVDRKSILEALEGYREENQPSVASTTSFYIKELSSVYDFKIARGFTTAYDVFKMDTQMEMYNWNMVYSYTFLDNGKVLEITYEKPQYPQNLNPDLSDYKVLRYTIVPKEKSASCLASILEKDLPK